MSTVQYGASAPTYHMVQRGHGRKQRVGFELQRPTLEPNTTSPPAVYEQKLNRFAQQEEAAHHELMSPPPPPPPPVNANPLDFDRNGVVSSEEIFKARTNPHQLSLHALELLKKIVEQQSALTNQKQALGLDTNNGLTRQVQGEQARTALPSFVGRSFSA